MFVLHAIVLTFITTPLTLLIYPPRVRGPGGANLEKALPPGTGGTSGEFTRSKFAVILDSVEQLPSAMTLIQLLRRPSMNTPSVTERTSIDKASIQSEALAVSYLPKQSTIYIDALRLVELTERTSAVMKSQAADTLVLNDPVLSVFRIFGRLNHFSMSAALTVISYDEFPTQVADHVRENGSQLTVIPWLVSPSSATGASSSSHTTSYNPFDSLFSNTSGKDEAAALLRSQFVRKVFANSSSDVALFIDRGLLTDSNSSIYPHIFLPFFGGPDDRLALSFVIQLCMHEGVSATVIRLQRLETDGGSVHTVGDKSVFHYGDVSLTPW